MLRKLYYKFSPRGRRFVRRLYFLPNDFISLFCRTKDELVPPKGKTNVGRGDFIKIGDKFFNDIIDTCNLSESARILDIGSGIGRIARPFTRFLNSDGEYRGFDILENEMKWCNKRYADFPAFSFNCYEVKNDLYLPKAKILADKFVFPYNDNYYDLAIVISVFTHLQTAATTNYFNQIGRILKKGGFCYASFFIANSDIKCELFPYVFDDYCLHNTRVKNANVAYRNKFIKEIASKSGLEIIQEKKGWWHQGKPGVGFDFQDILILKKL